MNPFVYFLVLIAGIHGANGVFALVDAIREERGYKKFGYALFNFLLFTGVILTIRWVQGLLP